MARIAGIDLPNEKRADIGLTSVYGIGRANVHVVLEKAGIEPSMKIKDISEEALNKLQKVVESMTVEGDLRREVAQNIKRLEEIGTYRGLRHRKGLPVRGQRTKANARTKKGKKKTVGTTKKETK